MPPRTPVGEAQRLRRDGTEVEVDGDGHQGVGAELGRDDAGGLAALDGRARDLLDHRHADPQRRLLQVVAHDGAGDLGQQSMLRRGGGGHMAGQQAGERVEGRGSAQPLGFVGGLGQPLHVARSDPGDVGREELVQQLGLGAVPLAEHGVDHQLLLAAEVGVDGPGGEAGPPGDGLHGRRLVAAGSEQLVRRLEQAVPSGDVGGRGIGPWGRGGRGNSHRRTGGYRPLSA